MKVTRDQLNQIIKEEIGALLSEDVGELDSGSHALLNQKWKFLMGIMMDPNRKDLELGLVHDMRKFRFKNMRPDEIDSRFSDVHSIARDFYRALLSVRDKNKGRPVQALLERMIKTARALLDDLETAKRSYMENPAGDFGDFVQQKLGYLWTSAKKLGVS